MNAKIIGIRIFDRDSEHINLSSSAINAANGHTDARAWGERERERERPRGVGSSKVKQTFYEGFICFWDTETND